MLGTVKACIEINKKISEISQLSAELKGSYLKIFKRPFLY